MPQSVHPLFSISAFWPLGQAVGAISVLFWALTSSPMWLPQGWTLFMQSTLQRQSERLSKIETLSRHILLNLFNSFSLPPGDNLFIYLFFFFFPRRQFKFLSITPGALQNQTCQALPCSFPSSSSPSHCFFRPRGHSFKPKAFIPAIPFAWNAPTSHQYSLPGSTKPKHPTLVHLRKRCWPCTWPWHWPCPRHSTAHGALELCPLHLSLSLDCGLQKGRNLVWFISGSSARGFCSAQSRGDVQ